MKKAITSEDLYPEGVDFHDYNGVAARKGTVAAVIANIKIFESAQSSEEEKQAALEQIRKDAITLIAVGLHDCVTWKNPKIQQVIDSVLLSSK